MNAVEEFVNEYLANLPTGFNGMLVIGDHNAARCTVIVRGTEMTGATLPGKSKHDSPLTRKDMVVHFISWTEESPWILLTPTEYLSRVKVNQVGEHPSCYTRTPPTTPHTYTQLPGSPGAIVEKRVYDLVSPHLGFGLDEVVIGFPLQLQLLIGGNAVFYNRKYDGSTYVSFHGGGPITNINPDRPDRIDGRFVLFSAGYNNAVRNGITAIDLRDIILAYKDKLNEPFRSFTPYSSKPIDFTDALIHVTEDNDVLFPPWLDIKPEPIYDTYLAISRLMYKSDTEFRSELIERTISEISAGGIDVSHLFKRYSQCRITYADPRLGKVPLDLDLTDEVGDRPKVTVVKDNIDIESILVSRLEITEVSFKDGPRVILPPHRTDL